MKDVENIINGHMNDVFHRYGKLVLEVENELKKYGEEGISVLRNNTPFLYRHIPLNNPNKSYTINEADKVRIVCGEFFNFIEVHVISINGEKADKWSEVTNMSMDDTLLLIVRTLYIYIYIFMNLFSYNLSLLEKVVKDFLFVIVYVYIIYNTLCVISSNR